MLVHRAPLAAAVALAVSAAACGPEGGGYAVEATMEAGLPGATIVGRFEAGSAALTSDAASRVGTPGSTARFDVVVNSQPRSVLIAPDRSFVIKELPFGTAALFFERGASHGNLTLDGLIAGEVVELVIRDQDRALEAKVVRRDRDRLAFLIPSYRQSGLQIIEGGGDYFVEPGFIIGNLEIDGSGVRVFGRNRDEPCDDRDRTVFSADLIIRGQEIEVYDVAMRGRLVVSGQTYRVHDPCDGLWGSDGAEHPFDRR
jgi:hypothetical protein